MAYFSSGLEGKSDAAVGEDDAVEDGFADEFGEGDALLLKEGAEAGDGKACGFAGEEELAGEAVLVVAEGEPGFAVEVKLPGVKGEVDIGGEAEDAVEEGGGERGVGEECGLVRELDVEAGGGFEFFEVFVEFEESGDAVDEGAFGGGEREVEVGAEAAGVGVNELEVSVETENEVEGAEAVAFEEEA
jgi:hypothetical protein